MPRAREVSPSGRLYAISGRCGTVAQPYTVVYRNSNWKGADRWHVYDFNTPVACCYTQEWALKIAEALQNYTPCPAILVTDER